MKKREFEIKVKKEVYIKTSPGISIWVLNPSYTSKDGCELIESVQYTTSTRFQKDWPKKSPEHLYDRIMQRRISRDNGITWEDQKPITDHRSGFSGTYWRLVPHHLFDPDNGLLLSIFCDLQIRNGQVDSNTEKMYYEISRDQGKTWEPYRQIIHAGVGYDEKNWMPGITCGKNGAGTDQGPFVRLSDGTIIFGLYSALALNVPGADHGGVYHVAFLRGRWKEDLGGIDWQMSEYLDVPIEERPSGVCEPDILYLGGQNLFTTMRSMGHEQKKIPSVRMASLSRDGGRTWSKPTPLIYDDGSIVWAAASPSAFMESPATGKVYWIANIQPVPVYGSYPRYPLTIAEFDRERLCIIRDSIRVIQDLPEGAPKERRYSNFGHYVDRVTGEFVLTLPEEPKISWEDYTADAVRYKITLVE